MIVFCSYHGPDSLPSLSLSSVWTWLVLEAEGKTWPFREGVWGPPSVGLNVAMCAWRPWGNAEVGGAPSEAGRGEGEAGGEGHRRMLQWRAHQVGPQMGTILVLALTPSVVRSSLKE